MRVRPPKRWALPSVALLVCVILSCGNPAWTADAPATTATAVKPALAERVVAETRRILANVKKTHYSHKTKVDEETGLYETDCSGLAALVLRAVSREALDAVQNAKAKRPRAMDFYEAFAAAPADKDTGCWRRILKLMDARPGDFVAWRKDEIVEGESTGHVMIIDVAPVREANSLVRVTVIDSTSKPHADDNRKPGQDGVGRGTVWFEIDGEGKPTGCRTRSPRSALIALSMAIGRPAENRD